MTDAPVGSNVVNTSSLCRAASTTSTTTASPSVVHTSPWDTPSTWPRRRSSRLIGRPRLAVSIASPRANSPAKRIPMVVSSLILVCRTRYPTRRATATAMGTAPRKGLTPIQNAATMPGSTEWARASPMNPSPRGDHVRPNNGTHDSHQYRHDQRSCHETVLERLYQGVSDDVHEVHVLWSAHTRGLALLHRDRKALPRPGG